MILVVIERAIAPIDQCLVCGGSICSFTDSRYKFYCSRCGAIHKWIGLFHKDISQGKQISKHHYRWGTTNRILKDPHLVGVKVRSFAKKIINDMLETDVLVGDYPGGPNYSGGTEL